jgi:hypothetical protein
MQAPTKTDKQHHIIKEPTRNAQQFFLLNEGQFIKQVDKPGFVL